MMRWPPACSRAPSPPAAPRFAPETARRHMSRSPELPPRVFPKGRWYYLVTAEGKKRVWTKLTKIRDGIPALYRKLADMPPATSRPTACPP
jgi:hypothetical protein